ncbi:methyltransferase family protein [Geothrix fuzhouensis]|uniref:methyltransferase family protein n=1 Tax=Geothrix fuzhouensis TaxID=2966451 RepID=UPI002148A263|nr:isoprenylcysteine carboxylmethyltransferase family protein [Geothrix fuzhouensis]
MDADRTGPGVRLPPPLVFISGLGLGFLLQSRFLLPFAAPGNPLPRLLGGVLVLGSGALALWGFLTFRRARTTVRPDRPASALLTAGPFHFTRNPLYLSLSLLHAGVALLANALWPALMLLPVLLVIRFHVIAREERHLAARFGADYQAYLRTVRRWF